MKADSRNIIPPPDNPSIEKNNPNQMTVILNTNQTMDHASTSMTLHKQAKTSCTVGHPLESDYSDSDTVFVTTEDDGVGGTVTLIRNLKGHNISKENDIVETEYVIQENLQSTTPHADNGKILRYFLLER